VVLGEETEATLALVEARLRASGLVLAGRSRLDSKILGFAPAFLEEVRCRDRSLTIVAECDGARGKSLKVPKPDEPPVAASTDVFVVMVGADCLGKPLLSEEVFEGEMVAAVAGVDVASLVDRRVVVRAVLSSDSYLGRRPAGARFCVFINKVDVESLDRPGPDANRGQVASAFEVGLALKTDGAVDRVIYGSLQHSAAKGFLVLN
jgi:probable selenium-dependent hydroxylase accessory protein YqeC